MAPEFIEPTPIEPLNEIPKVFTNEFISKVIKDSIAKGDIPEDHKLAIVGVVDENGIGAILSVKIVDRKVGNENHLNIKFQSVVEHDWSGDNKAGAKLLFSIK